VHHVANVLPTPGAAGFSLAPKEKEILKDLNLKENYYGY
jgi:hypothetical protein